MHIALIGSHGTGKTTVFKQLKLLRPDCAFFAEGVRHQVPAFGFKTPYEIVDQFGIAAFELMNANSWSVIDPAQNTELMPGKTVITDRSAIENWAYDLVMRSSERDAPFEPLLFRVVSHYAKLIDRFIYFPTGAIPLVGDEMRRADPKLQLDVDDAIFRAMDQIGIKSEHIYHLQSVRIENRVSEVLALLPPA